MRPGPQVDNKSSLYDSTHPGTVRRDGSFIYEEFLPTGGTDVKVYTVRGGRSLAPLVLLLLCDLCKVVKSQCRGVRVGPCFPHACVVRYPYTCSCYSLCLLV